MNEIVKIENKIYTIRSLQVMLDRDLAELYQVETKRINEAVKRNIERFDDDFLKESAKHKMFQLTQEEFNNLKSHFATANFSKVRTNPKV